MRLIKIKDCYNVLTTQGEGEKYINVEAIVSITRWSSITNKRISTIKARIKLIDGEILDIKESIEEIYKKIELATFS